MRRQERRDEVGAPCPAVYDAALETIRRQRVLRDRDRKRVEEIDRLFEQERRRLRAFGE